MVNLTERMMILELHQQGLSVSAIAAKGLVAFLLALSQGLPLGKQIGGSTGVSADPKVAVFSRNENAGFSSTSLAPVFFEEVF